MADSVTLPEKQSNRIQTARRGGARPGAGRKPGGRSQSTIDGQKLAQQWGPAAIQKAAQLAGLILEVVPNKEGDGEMEVPVGQAASEAVRVSALNIIIERAFGKAAQPLNHGDNEGGKLSPTLNILGTGNGQSAPARKAGNGVPERGD